MKGLNDFITEDTNQFGPGTDLVIGIMALLLVLITISNYLYGRDKQHGNFKTASVHFSAGDFKTYPVTEFVDKERVEKRIRTIVKEYQNIEQEYAYLFVIGHANRRDVPDAIDKSDRARRERNWLFAGRRAAVIAGKLQQQLTPRQREKIVLVSTGEFDRRITSDPDALENAWVEVVFGREWKLPAYKKIRE
jgi:hypothetical protein